MPEQLPANMPEPTLMPKGPGRINQLMTRVWEIISPYVTTGMAGEAQQTLNKHNKELESLLTEIDTPSGSQTDEQIMQTVTME